MHVVSLSVLVCFLTIILYQRNRSRKSHDEQEVLDAVLQRSVVRLPYDLHYRILSHVVRSVDLTCDFPHKGLWRILTISRDMYQKMMPVAYEELYLHASVSVNRLRYTLVVQCPSFATYVRHISICHCDDLAPLALEQLLLSTTHVSSMHLDGVSARAMCMSQAGRLSKGAKPTILSWDFTTNAPSSIQLDILSNFDMWQRVELLYICGDPLLAHVLSHGVWPQLRQVCWFVPFTMMKDISTVVMAQAMRGWSNRGISLVWDNSATRAESPQLEARQDPTRQQNRWE